MYCIVLPDYYGKYGTLIGLLLFIVCDSVNTENIDVALDQTEIFCYPEIYKNTRKSCECSNVSASPWGIRAVHIDCSYKDFKNTDITTLLPLYIDTLDLSWNVLELIPPFVSHSLRSLNLMHNNISSIISKNFAKLANLREVYLNWNGIQSIEAAAFDNLAHLQILDLSHNNIHKLPLNIFAPLLILQSLNLSWNRQLNESNGIQELDFYETYGINQKLQTLKLDACSLSSLYLPAQATLQELYLRHNKFKIIPQGLPATLQKLDLSANLLEALISADTANLTNITEFYLEDMPRLQSIEENALAACKTLKKLSFQNSRQLSYFNGYAFGRNIQQYPPLQSISFRGTFMRTLNITLAAVFSQLTELDLNGVPLLCDCHMIWVQELVETNGRCFQPARLRGLGLKNVHTSELTCSAWPEWIYGIVILGLIALCSAGIYYIVMGLRPHRGVTMRRKVGAGSPYARVTIEPNRQENNFY